MNVKKNIQQQFDLILVVFDQLNHRLLMNPLEENHYHYLIHYQFHHKELIQVQELNQLLMSNQEIFFKKKRILVFNLYYFEKFSG